MRQFFFFDHNVVMVTHRRCDDLVGGLFQRSSETRVVLGGRGWRSETEFSFQLEVRFDELVDLRTELFVALF